MKSLARSFTGGEITPELYGYLGLPRFQTGLAKALNFTILPHGPAQNRAGFGYVLEAKDSTQAVRIYNFAFSTEQTYILEFGHQYVRFFTNGGALLESAKTVTGITDADPGVVTSAGHDFANGDMVYAAAVVGMTEVNGRFFLVANQTANTFELQMLDGSDLDTSGYTAYASGGTVARVYTVTTPYDADDLFGLKFTQSVDVLSIAHKGYAVRELSRLGAVSWSLDVVSFALSAPTPPAVIPYTAWDFEGAEFRVSKGLTGGASVTRGLTFKPDGLIMYIVDSNGQDIYEYSLSVPWDVSTAGSYDQVFDVSTEDTLPVDVAFSTSGEKMYVLGQTGQDINEYDLSVAWDISTAIYSQNFSISSQETMPLGFTFSPSGLKMYVVGSTGDDVNEYTLSSAWDMSSAGYVRVFSVSSKETAPSGIHFRPNGSEMYVTGSSSADVHKYILSTAWNVSTATFSYSLSSLRSEPGGLFFSSNGLKMYITHNSSPFDFVYEYALRSLLTDSTIVEQYKCTSIAAETLEESLPSTSVSVVSDLSVANNFVGIDPSTVSGAARYKIYKEQNGLYGYIGETEGGEFVDDNIIPDASRTPPEVYEPFGTADDYPNAIGHEEGRGVFAGTNNKPQGFWLAASQTQYNLTYHIPLVDTDAIVGNILANQMNRIRHIVSLGGLIFLTAGGEWTMSPENAADILTPSTITPRKWSSEGASNVQPLEASDAIIYVHENQKRVMELKVRAETGKLTPIDASVIAPHLFDGYTIVDSAYTKSPNKVCWFVRSDGVLLGMTYVPEYKIMAWHQHSTINGVFESVAAAREGSRDVLYAVIKRMIDSRTVRYVERLADRNVLALADQIIVDSAISYTGSAATTLRGFDHLKGESVVGIDNGGVLTALTVSSDGVVTLPADSSGDVHLGLAITADLQMLPLAMETAEAFGQGTKINLSKVYLRVYGSSGMQAGPDFDSLRAYPLRSDENYDSPPDLVTGVVTIGLDGKWTDSSQLAIRQTEPLPISVLSHVLEYVSGG